MPICSRCNKSMDETRFYTYKDGKKTELCKKCLTAHVDCFDPETFLWLMEKMDVPYVPQEWNVLRDKDYAKDPHKLSGTAVFGKYLSKMRLKQWSKYGWADTEELQAQNATKEEADIEAQKHFEEEMKEKYEKGEINEAQYKTLVSTETQYAEENLAPPPIINDPYNGYNEENYLSEEELIDPAADLTQEDKIYLAMKWGRLYKPNEWIELERKYTEMMNSFDIQDSDTIGTLILICKTYLKMNQAIDIGDLDGYQKLSRTYDTLRKSAKFTAAQKKEEKEEFVDSVGEMVAYCERMGGAIPEYEIKVELDIVDKVIQDMKGYTRSLIYEDTALARQIEDYLKKKQISDTQKKDKKEAKEKGLDNVLVEDEDIKEYLNIIEEEKELDSMAEKEEEL